MIDTLLDFVPDEVLPTATLLELTGDKEKAAADCRSSGLQQRVAEAWIIPMAELNCGQCRVLVGQRLGLLWLAGPVATFVARYPQAECDLYPGDLTVNAVIAWRDFKEYAPEETSAMLAQDFDWLKRDAADDEWEGSILKRAVESLDEALHA